MVAADKMNSGKTDGKSEGLQEKKLKESKRLIEDCNQKLQKEETNRNLYAYMHDIFGSDVIELFDMKYDPKDSLDIGDSQQG